MPSGARLLPALGLMALLGGCGGEEEPPRPVGWFDPGVASTEASPPLQLHRLEGGRYTLPEVSAPPGHDPTQGVELSLVEQGNTGRMRRFATTLPYDLGLASRKVAPDGMRARLPDGRELPYGSGTPHWTVRRDQLIVASAEPVTSVVVSWDEARTQSDRLHFGRAGLSAEAFVRYSLSLNDVTRDGLLLPAPATAEWDLTVPERQPVFDAWLAMAPPALQMEQSDGAVVHLEVLDGDKVIPVDRRNVRGQTETYEPWRVDLSRFAGKQVTLRLKTEPGASEWFDFVFVGAPSIWGKPAGDVRRIVVIGLDTTRPDHISWYGYERPTTPELDRVLDQSAVFTEAWCPAPRTRPSFRSATTGRYPLKAVGATNIGEVFRDEGFATAGIVTNVHLHPRFDFDKGFDLWWYEAKSDAAQQVDRALAWLDAHRDRDTYLFLHIMDPHIYYNAPGAFRNKFVTDPDPNLPKVFNRWAVYQMEARGELTPQRKAHIEALYDGELAYTSNQLGRFFKGLDAMGGDSLVVIHSDHGEEFWEHGGFEHNHTLYDEVTKAVLAIRPGRGMAEPIRIDTPTTLADIGPTLYDFAGIARPPPTDGRSLRPLVEGNAEDAGWDRPIDLGFLRYGRERWGVVWNGHKYIVDTKVGEEELYDLAADPGEHRNLADQADLAPWRAKLAEAHEMPAGRGWRVYVDLLGDTQTPWTFTLPEAPVQAGVLDPERTVENPANQTWGDPPTRTPAEIGETQLDGTTLTWTPGTNPQGGQLVILWGEEDLDLAELSVRRGDEPVELIPGPDGSRIWRSGRDSVRVVQSTVVLPLPGEADLIRMLESRDGEASDEQIAWLEAMGYLGGGDEGGDADSDDEEGAP